MCRRLITVSLVVLVTLVSAPTAVAGIVPYVDSDDWVDAVGPDYRFIDFTGLESFVEIVTDQYADLGVHFIGSPESTDVLALDSDSFNDGEGILSLTEILIEFDAPTKAIGFQLPASFARVDFLDADGNIIDDAGTIVGPFLGVTTNFEFHGVKLLTIPDTAFQIDDLYVGPPIPAPAGLGLLALAGSASRRRPRG